jgi:hypothetical protein
LGRRHGRIGGLICSSLHVCSVNKPPYRRTAINYYKLAIAPHHPAWFFQPLLRHVVGPSDALQAPRDIRRVIDAANNRDKNYTAAKVASRMKQVQDNVDRYLDALDRTDREENDIAEPKAKRLAEKIARLRAQMRDLAAREEEVRNASDQQLM